MRLLIATLLLLCASASAASTNIDKVTADYETDPVLTSGDAADDTAVWINHKSPEKSLIVGTDKKAGLHLYNLHGKEVDFLPAGKVNNVDLRNNVIFNHTIEQVIVGTNRTNSSISFFRVTKNKLENIGSLPLSYTPYGICLSLVDKKLQIFISTKEGFLDRWQAEFVGTELRAKHVSKIKFQSQIEGCDVDDESGLLVVGEEDVGVWRVNIKAVPSKPELIDAVGARLKADVEGIAIYRSSTQSPTVLVSSQGDSSYQAYDLYTGQHRGAFQIAAGTVDGVTHTDGIAVTSMATSPEFPYGFFVAQDDVNTAATGELSNQNFKIVDWRKIANALSHPKKH